MESMKLKYKLSQCSTPENLAVTSQRRDDILGELALSSMLKPILCPYLSKSHTDTFFPHKYRYVRACALRENLPHFGSSGRNSCITETWQPWAHSRELPMSLAASQLCRRPKFAYSIFGSFASGWPAWQQISPIWSWEYIAYTGSKGMDTFSTLCALSSITKVQTHIFASY